PSGRSKTTSSVRSRSRSSTTSSTATRSASGRVAGLGVSRARRSGHRSATTIPPSTTTSTARPAMTASRFPGPDHADHIPPAPPAPRRGPRHPVGATTTPRGGAAGGDSPPSSRPIGGAVASVRGARHRRYGDAREADAGVLLLARQPLLLSGGEPDPVARGG